MHSSFSKWVLGVLYLGFGMSLEFLYCGFRLYSKTCVKQPLSKRPKIGFQDQLSLNAGHSIAEHSATLLTCIKLPFVIKIFVSSIF